MLTYLVLVLTSKKDKKVDLVAVKEIPDTFVYDDCLTTMDIIVVGFNLYIVMGLFNGTVRFIAYQLEDDLGEDKTGARFFSRKFLFEESINLQFPITSLNLKSMTQDENDPSKIDLIASSSLGYVIVFQNFLEKKFEAPMIYTLRSENKMETVNDAVTIDIDGDGEKEIVAVTYFGGLYILKRIENELTMVESKDLEGCYYDAYVDIVNDKRYIILCGDNEVRIFEVTV